MSILERCFLNPGFWKHGQHRPTLFWRECGRAWRHCSGLVVALPAVCNRYRYTPKAIFSVDDTVMHCRMCVFRSLHVSQKIYNESQVAGGDTEAYALHVFSGVSSVGSHYCYIMFLKPGSYLICQVPFRVLCFGLPPNRMVTLADWPFVFPNMVLARVS